MELLPALLAGLLVVAAARDPESAIPNIARDCQGADTGSILLERDHWYSYEARVLGRTASVGATDQDAQLDLRCSLKVQHSQECAFTLEFETCSLKSSYGNEGDREAWLDENNWTQFSEHPIAFTVNGGEVRNVLTHPEDPVSVVNIKKGIISALIIGNQPTQRGYKFSTTHLHRDVQGLCPLTIGRTPDGEIRITKDQAGCKLPDKPPAQNSPFSPFWDMSFMRYLVNSSLICDVKLENYKLLRNLKCSERHAGIIDSSDYTKFGLVTSIGYEFTLQESGTSKSGRGLQVDQLRQTGIEYEYEKPNAENLHSERNLAEAKDLLKNLLDDSEIDLDTIPLFQNLVERMRHVTDLKELTLEAESCPGDQKDCGRRQKGLPLYQNALVQCNRLPCLREFRDLQTRQLVKKDFLELAIFSWLRMPISDPNYIDEFLEICQSSQTRFCWLGLGGIIKSYGRDHHQDVHNAITYVSHILGVGESCGLNQISFPSPMPNDQKSNYIITMLKTIGNMGPIALTEDPSLERKLFACAMNKELANPARVAAIQTLGRVSAENDEQLFSMMSNHHDLPVEIRIASYVALIETEPHNPGLATKLVSILKDDPSNQVRSYVASDLRQREKYDNNNSTSFWRNLHTELSEQHLSLPKLVKKHRHTTSHVNVRKESWELPFLPKELKDFGHHLLTSAVFGDYSAIPQSITANLNLTLFGQVMDFMEVGLQMAGLDGVAVRSSTILNSMRSSGRANPMQYVALFLQQLSPPRKSTASRKKVAAPPVLLNRKWEENADKIYQAYQNSHVNELAPHLLLYLRMFGLDLDFTSLPDLTGKVQRLMHEIGERQKQKSSAPPKPHIPFSRTHVINFIEAEHLFPTLMGVSLKWRCNASVAVSLDAKLDINMKAQLGTLHLKPRFAATMINQMVLEIPGVTEMGIQSNNSMFSATQWDLEASVDADKAYKISLLTPKTKQRPMELYRNNYILHGGKVSELADWNVARTEYKECLGEKFFKATGMSVCIESSHLDVKHRQDKPFYLLSGRAHWILSAEMTDLGVKDYSLTIAYVPKSKDHIALDIVANGKGVVLQRQVPLKVSFNRGTGEFELDLKHSDFPDFGFLVKRDCLKEEGQHVGFKSSVTLKEEGKTWSLIYSKLNKTEIREDKPMSRNESPRKQNLEAHLQERQLQLKSPANEYLFKLKLHKQPDTGNLKVDTLLSATNLDEDHNWLNRILPEIFWENSGRKAWLEFRGDWKFGDPKAATHKGPHGQHRQSKSHLSIPATVIEVLTHHMHKAKHSMYCYNISKVEKATGKKLVFANFTYNVWHKGAHGEPVNDIRTANFTIPRHSWNVDFTSRGNYYTAVDGEITDTFLLSGEKMVPLDPKDSKYIGWWEPESVARFKSQRWHITYKHHLRRKPVGESDLPLDSRNEIKDDLSSEEDDGHSSEEAEMAPSARGARNEIVHADAYLDYPFSDKQENLTFTGSFQWNQRKAPVYKIFMKTFTMASTLHSLQLDSHSVYTTVGNERKVLSHQSTFIDPQTQRNQGVYKLLLRKELKNSCWGINLNHSISAHWLNFGSTITGTCKPGKPKARLYNIHIQSQKPYWKELNYNLDQTFDFDQPGGESMNLTSDTMDIHVTGSWDKDYYRKRAQFDSKTDVMPSTVWTLDSDKKGQTTVILAVTTPDSELEKLTFVRKVNEEQDHVEYNLTHIDRANPDVIHEDFQASGCILDAKTMRVKGSWRPELGSHLGKWLARFVPRVIARIKSKLSDPQHEFNKILAERLKGKTISQYLEDLEKRTMRVLMTGLHEAKEIVETFESFYKPSFEIVGNSFMEFISLMMRLEQEVDNTNIGWAWNYFELDDYLTYVKNHQPTSRDPNAERKFDYDLDHGLTWKKFNELPRLKEDHHAFHHWLSAEEAPFAVPVRKPHGRIALLYGPSHVLTFDGRPISFPDYPSESCTILLSQDVRGKSYTAMSNRESFFLVFPEMSVTIHGSGRLYINSSQDESPTPVSSANKQVVVKRIGEIIRVESPYLQVDCDTANEFCVLVLDPLLSGGVIGILGNADGERNNDLMGPQNNRVSTISELAAIYELSGDPACQNYVEKPEAVTEDPQATKRCDRLLKQESVVQCLSSAGLSEKDFRGSCVSDFQREGCPCATSKALAALCAYDGHKLDRCQFLPRPESAVPVPNQHDSWLVKGTHQLQVVLAVEAHGSVLGGGSGPALKGLETLLENLEESFTSNAGFSSITYSLVAYGGEGEPHLHTQHRSSWMLQRDLLKSVRDMKFKGSKRGDPIAALEFAASMLPFEPAATKIIVLIALDDNPEASDRASDHLHAVQNLLTRNGVALYVVASYPWLEHGKKVFGLRADGLIFPSTGGESYANFPRSPAAKMAAGTRGAIFWRPFLEDNKNPYFFENMVEEMLARVKKEAGRCKQCGCAMSPWWLPRQHCKPASEHLQNC